MTVSSATIFKLLPFLVIGSVLMGGVYQLAKPVIDEQKRQQLENQLRSVYPLSEGQFSVPQKITGKFPLVLDSQQQSQYWLVCSRHDFSLRGIILSLRSKQGYAGNIDLLVAYSADLRVMGVDVLSHTETPGLGDKIEPKKSRWLEQFQNTNSNQPWRLKKQFAAGFEGITAATITSQAVIKLIPHGFQIAASLLSQSSTTCQDY